MHRHRRIIKDQTRESCLQDLLELLSAHPAGLRRWSVMREMRLRREKAGFEVTPNFESEIERIFCRHCRGDSQRARWSDGAPELFHRPQGRTGEVWASCPKPS